MTTSLYIKRCRRPLHIINNVRWRTFMQHINVHCRTDRLMFTFIMMFFMLIVFYLQIYCCEQIFNNSELIYKSKLICFLVNKIIHKALWTRKSKKARKMNVTADVIIKTLKYNLIWLHVDITLFRCLKKRISDYYLTDLF